MQGCDENILTSSDKIMAFIEKLNLWKTKINQEYPEISIKPLTILLPFSTSYLCEQGFSALTNIKNKKREKREKLNSVEEEMRVGLNFDFIALNLIGFMLYSMFNVGLWIPEIEKDYFARYPRGLNPVQLNDIFFSIHAVFATLITVTQCYFYEKGDQQLSRTVKSIMSFYGLLIAILLVLVYLQKIVWLDFLYYCSYIKLTITLIKYIPQAVMNYKRKSTIGWSIGNIFLDFIGGLLSILQMIINAYNYNDWASVFGDPTKFGLGLLSVIFDILFFLQHYVFYRPERGWSYDRDYPKGVTWTDDEDPSGIVRLPEYTKLEQLGVVS
ncbi:cystinosin homolog [Metopolophium dirhodum]|uniref:cystinosin homolog n=1 Tax=Metopolophium dirhodum TaxID=44670 RepID=UPI00298F4DF1|nr:cystinosin homolog [Metopolophium dirhodum]